MDLNAVTNKSPISIFFQLDKKNSFNAFSIVAGSFLVQVDDELNRFVAGTIKVYNVAENIYKIVAVKDPDILDYEFKDTCRIVGSREDRKLIFCGRRLEG